MSDKFQQLKGLLGLEIAKLYLQQVRGYEIVDEELPVNGLNNYFINGILFCTSRFTFYVS